MHSPPTFIALEVAVSNLNGVPTLVAFSRIFVPHRALHITHVRSYSALLLEPFFLVRVFSTVITLGNPNYFHYRLASFARFSVTN